MTEAQTGEKGAGPKGHRCASWRSGCTNRVAHPLDVCRACVQQAQEELEEKDGHEPDDFQKDFELAEQGYGDDPRGDL